MEHKKIIKNATIGLLISAIAIGGAYAFLKNSAPAEKTNVIKVGTSRVYFNNQSDVINLDGNDAIPMTKAYATMTNTVTQYKFDVKDDGPIAYDFSISAIDDGSTIDPSLIELALNPLYYNTTTALYDDKTEPEFYYEAETLYGSANLSDVVAKAEELNASMSGSEKWEQSSAKFAETGMYTLVKVKEVQVYDEATVWVKLSDSLLIQKMSALPDSLRTFTLATRIVESAEASDVLNKQAKFHLELTAVQNNSLVSAEYFVNGGDVIKRATYEGMYIYNQQLFSPYMEGDVYEFVINESKIAYKTANGIYGEYEIDTNDDGNVDTIRTIFSENAYGVGDEVDGGKVITVLSTVSGTKIR